MEAEQQQSPQEVTVVLLGRTGSGKSSLGNKIAGADIFEVGHELHSFTSNTLSQTINLQQMPSVRVKIIDTPGLADNREGMSTAKLFSDILTFLKELENGFNIGIYCLPVKARVDAHDINELELLSLLLGQEVFNHTLIAVTQVNTLEKSERQKVYQKYPIELPEILDGHHLQGFGPDRILFADFENFKKGFMDPFIQFLKTTPSYKPQLAEGLDPKDPESIERLLATPQMKAVTKKYEEMMEKQRQEINKMHNIMRQQKAEMEKMIAVNLEEQEISRRRIEDLNKKISGLGEEKKLLAETFKRYREEEIRKVDELNQSIQKLDKKNEICQRQLLEKEDQFSKVTTQLRELERTRTEAQANRKERRSNFFDGILQNIVGTVANFALEGLRRLF